MRIAAKSWTLPLAFSAASVVTLGLTTTLLVLKHRQGGVPLGMACFLTPFLLAGIGLAWLAGREIVQLLRHGTWEIEIPDRGAVLGRSLPVRILPARAITPSGELKATLSCQRSVTHRSRGGATTPRSQTTVLGSSEATLAVGRLDPSAATPVAVTLDVPAHLPASTPSADTVAVTWQLSLEIPTADGGFLTQFEVPVRPA